MTLASLSLSRSARFCSLVLSLAFPTAILAQAQTSSPTQKAPPVLPHPPGSVTVAGTPQAANIPAYLRLASNERLNQEEPRATPKDDASHQGITVHGHWLIDVRNPDGTLAEHRDFQNSLVGPNDMLGFLYGSEVPSDFAIYFTGATPPCIVSAGDDCDLVHNLSVLPASARCTVDYCVTGLTITPTFGASPALVLAGNMTATQAGTITTVGTYIGICGSPTGTPSTVTAASCAAGNNPYGYGSFTQTNITALAVASGQIVQVTVTITFS